MRRLRIPVPILKNSLKTYLSEDYISGTELTVANNYGAEANKIIIVGEPGEETTEDKHTTGQTSSTVVNLGSEINFDHNKGDVVYIFEYDQVEIYRRRSGSWSLISTSNIQWDQGETVYIDDTGDEEDSYKYRLKNSQSGETSSYSPTIAATGLADNTVGYMIERVRKIGGDEKRRVVTDTELIRQFNRALEIIEAHREDWWFLLVDTYEASNGITTTQGEDKYSLSTYSDLNYISTIRYNITDDSDESTYHLKQVDKLALEYSTRDETRENDDYVEEYTLLPPDSSSDQGYFRVWPSPDSTDGTFYPDYYKKMSNLGDVADVVEFPLPSILEDFALSYLFQVKGNEEKAEVYKERFYGPTARKIRIYGSEPSGIRLLEKMQQKKKGAVGQPKSLKKFRGRKALNRFFKEHTTDRDYIAEKYF